MAAISKVLTDFIHFDTDEQGRSLHEEFKIRFKEEPPPVVIDVLNQIGNPVKRMDRMDEILDFIVQSLEKVVNADKDEPEVHESYYRTPEGFEQIFHKRHSKRRHSSNEGLPGLAKNSS